MLRRGGSSLGMDFGGGFHHQPRSVSRCGAAALCTAKFGGFLCKTLIPERGVCPAPSLRPRTVTSADCTPASPPDDAVKPAAGTTTSRERFYWLQLCRLALGCTYPPFFGSHARREQVQPPPAKKTRLHLFQRVSFSIAPQTPEPRTVFCR